MARCRGVTLSGSLEGRMASLMIMMSSNQCLAPVALIWSSDAGREMMRTVTETSITQESATLCVGCPAGWMDATELETEHQKHIRGWYRG
jgi:hypothetical protein